MASLSQKHEELTNGVGACSVPMWQMGCPAGFCDKPAYGQRPESRQFRDRNGRVFREDGKYAGYVPALACPGHGGPTLLESLKDRIVIRFDGPPGPEVKAERNGVSVNVGQWIQDGAYWLLVLNPDLENQNETKKVCPCPGSSCANLDSYTRNNSRTKD